MEIDIKLKGVDEVLAQLNTEAVKKATVRTVNELGSELKTQTVKETRKKYNISAARLKGKLKVRKANYSNMRWSMTIPRDKKLNLINFAARQVKKGVSVKVLQSGGRKTVKGAFIANDGKTVFTRKTKKRLPIKTVTGLSPSQMISNKLRDKKLEEIEKKAPKRFRQNFNFYISK